MTGYGPAARSPMLVPPVRDFVAHLSRLQRISTGFAVAGSLLLFLGMAFNWYRIAVSVEGAGMRYTQEGGTGFGSLLGGDLERRYSNLGLSRGSGPDIDSYAEWYAVGYLVLAILLVTMVFGSPALTGNPQLYLRIGGGAAAALSLILVILISADLAGMADAVEDYFRDSAGDLEGLGVRYRVDPSVGAGLVLSASASILLGVAAGLNQPRTAGAAPAASVPRYQVSGVPYGAGGVPTLAPPGAWSQPASAPPAVWAQPASAPPASPARPPTAAVGPPTPAAGPPAPAAGPPTAARPPRPPAMPPPAGPPSAPPPHGYGPPHR